MYDFNGKIISPIRGKKVIWIGDSNTDYNKVAIQNAIEKLGGTLYSYALAGYAWENTDLTNDNTVMNHSGMGQVNKAISEHCNGNNYFGDEYIVIFMMGTNRYGELGNWTDTTVSTVRGACEYCLKTIAFYGRTIPVGVILPWCGQDNVGLKERAMYYGFPVIDLESECRIISDAKVGQTAYLGTSGNHFGANGQKHFLRIIMNWLQYRI